MKLLKKLNEQKVTSISILHQATENDERQKNNETEENGIWWGMETVVKQCLDLNKQIVTHCNCISKTELWAVSCCKHRSDENKVPDNFPLQNKTKYTMTI